MEKKSSSAKVCQSCNTIYRKEEDKCPNCGNASFDWFDVKGFDKQ